MSNPELTPTYLRSLPSIRARSNLIYDLAKENKLKCFELHEDKFGEVVGYCRKTIEASYGTNYASIPPHSRWRHFTTPLTPDLLSPLIRSWESSGVDKLECTRNVLDLFVVSVLVDAGAGPTWSYLTKSSERVNRSEGLAVASLEMFEGGLFSSSKDDPFRVDSKALLALTLPLISQAFQSSPQNSMTGLEGRAKLLMRLGEVLEGAKDGEGREVFRVGEGFRPGGMVDYLIATNPSLSSSTTAPSLPINSLWSIVMDHLGPVWPSTRITLEGKTLGDAWVCEALKEVEGEGTGAGIVPFHKLSQWLTYSLMEPLQKIMGWEIAGVDTMTGLPEYRNGGLLVDLGMLSLKPYALDNENKADSQGDLSKFEVYSQTVIEWRALTVVILDKIAAQLKLDLNAPNLTTAQVLESATWKSGRLIAKELRGESGKPPIEVISDGTVF